MCYELGAKPENLFERRCQIVCMLPRKRSKSAVSVYVLRPVGRVTGTELPKIWIVLRVALTAR